MKKLLVVFCAIMLLGTAGAADLRGTASVRMTSDTSAVAKMMAINDARRQILMDKLQSYAVPDQLAVAIRDAQNSELIELIAETIIDGEQISDTAYSANITMVVDKIAARKWMTENNVQNWLTFADSVDGFSVLVVLGEPINDWAQIQLIARSERIDFITKHIVGNRVTIEIPSSSRTQFTIALRGAGWKTATDDGFMRVWK